MHAPHFLTTPLSWAAGVLAMIVGLIPQLEVWMRIAALTLSMVASWYAIRNARKNNGTS